MLNVSGGAKGNGVLNISNTGTTESDLTGLGVGLGYTQTGGNINITSSYAINEESRITSTGFYLMYGDALITGGSLNITAGDSDHTSTRSLAMDVDNGSLTVGSSDSDEAPTIKAQSFDCVYDTTALYVKSTFTLYKGNIEVSAGSSTANDVRGISTERFVMYDGDIVASSGSAIADREDSYAIYI